MIRAVDNKRLFLTDKEYSYYQALIEEFGKDEFRGLFETNKEGQIVAVTPPLGKQVSMGVLFFTLNIMMNQRIRATQSFFEKKIANLSLESSMDEKLEALEKRLAALEEKESNDA